MYIPQEWRCDSARWNMLKYYALSYPKWINEVNDIKLEYRAACGVMGSGGDGASEVERKVERIEKLRENIELIERCCRKATEQKSNVYYYALLTAVTTQIPISHIPSPIGRRQMFTYKREFYYLLDDELSKKNIL